jgi:hypothetical protein
VKKVPTTWCWYREVCLWYDLRVGGCQQPELLPGTGITTSKQIVETLTSESSILRYILDIPPEKMILFENMVVYPSVG